MRRLAIFIINLKKYPHAIINNTRLCHASKLVCSDRIAIIKKATEEYGIIPAVFVINDPEEETPDLYKHNPLKERFNINYTQNIVAITYTKIILGVMCVFRYSIYANKYFIKAKYKYKLYELSPLLDYNDPSYLYYVQYNIHLRYEIIKQLYGILSNAARKEAAYLYLTQTSIVSSTPQMLYKNSDWLDQWRDVWHKLHYQDPLELEAYKIININW